MLRARWAQCCCCGQCLDWQAYLPPANSCYQHHVVAGKQLTLHQGILLPQGLSNIVWAYAKLSALPSPRTEESSSTEGTAKGAVESLLNALAVEAVKQLLDVRHSHKFIPQNLSNMVYGCVHVSVTWLTLLFNTLMMCAICILV